MLSPVHVAMKTTPGHVLRQGVELRTYFRLSQLAFLADAKMMYSFNEFGCAQGMRMFCHVDHHPKINDEWSRQSLTGEHCSVSTGHS